MHFVSLVKQRSSKLQIKKKQVDKQALVQKILKPEDKKIDEKFKDYKELLHIVTTKIDDWHQSVSKKKKGKFENDDDFFEIEASPTKFHSRCSSSSEDCSFSKESTYCRSPKLQNYDSLDTRIWDGNRHKIRISKKKGKSSGKFKFKRNSTIFNGKKPNSPDIRRRRSFKKYLKGSSQVQRSSRFNKEDYDSIDQESDILCLQPMLPIKNEIIDTIIQKVPILKNENNIIQEQTFSSEICESKNSPGREKSHRNKLGRVGITVRNMLYDGESNEHKSLSMARSGHTSAYLKDSSNAKRKNSLKKINSLKYDEQKYNLEWFKRRTKGSKNNVVKSNLKWSVLNGEHNYNSSLPMITKTRTNISGDNYSLDHISNEVIANQRQKSQWINEQPYNEA